MRTLFIATITILFLVSCNTNNSKKEEKLKAELDKIREEVGVPGINLAIILPGGESIAISSGYADKENKVLLKPNDKMFSGSTGKTFCAAIILQLIDEGKINLDDPISKYFGDEVWFSRIPNASEVSIQMLLNHTTGIPRYVFDDSVWKAMQENPDKTWTGEERLSLIFDKDPVHPAGKDWAYSDTNYIILGMLIERITGNEYYAELSDRILEPQKLVNTLPGNSREIDGIVTGYTSYTDLFLLPEKVLLENGKFAFNPQMEFTGGGIACTTLDLAKWGKIYYGGELFSVELSRKMLTPCGLQTSLADNAGYGFAAFVWNENSVLSYGHTGLFPGYVTIFEYIPELDMSLAMQWNTDHKNPEKSLHQYLNDIKKLIDL